MIHANITETYPQTPPVWFSESEDPKVAEAVSCLTGTSGLDNHLLYQVPEMPWSISTTIYLLPLSEVWVHHLKERMLDPYSPPWKEIYF